MKRDIKISGVHIYSRTGGGYAIEAKIDGINAGPENLSKEDVISLTEKTDRRKLAEKYLTPKENTNEKNFIFAKNPAFVRRVLF